MQMVQRTSPIPTSILLLALAASPLLAQSSNTGGRVDGRGELPPVPPSRTDAPAAPVEPSLRLSISGLPEGFDLRRPPAGSFREAQFVSRIRGTIRRTSAEDYVFLPDPGVTLEDAPLAPPAPPMVLLPCQRLALVSAGVQTRTRGAAEDQTPPQARATLSGVLHSYRGRAFLLPTSVVFEDASPAEPPAASMPPANSATDATPTDGQLAATTDPAKPAEEVSAIIKDLEQAWSTRRTLARPQRNEADRELDQSANVEQVSGRGQPMLLPERTILSQVRGRLVRLAEADGRFAFALDNDPDSPNPTSAPEPLLLLPCRQLEQIEDAVGQLGDTAAFTLTGRVYEYRGLRYVMPIAFQLSPVKDVKPAQ
jgi:hypothetical protein